jgi:hypothetical protein
MTGCVALGFAFARVAGSDSDGALGAPPSKSAFLDVAVNESGEL